MAKLTSGQRVALISSAVVGILVGSASLSWSVWSDANAGDGISTSIGALNLDLDTANGTWTRTTPGYAAQICGPFDFGTSTVSTNCATDPQTVVTMPGDTFEYVVPITITMQGKNLAAMFNLAFESDSGVQDAINAGNLAVTYYLANPGSAPYNQAYPSTGTPMNWDVDLGIYVMDMLGGYSSWNLIVDIEVLGNYFWASDLTQYLSGGSWNTAAVSASLVQVRGGGDD